MPRIAEQLGQVVNQVAVSNARAAARWRWCSFKLLKRARKRTKTR